LISNSLLLVDIKPISGHKDAITQIERVAAALVACNIVRVAKGDNMEVWDHIQGWLCLGVGRKEAIRDNFLY